MTKASEQSDTTSEKHDGEAKKNSTIRKAYIQSETETLFVNMRAASKYESTRKK